MSPSRPSRRLFAALALLAAIAGCGGQTYEQALQRYKTESDILDDLVQKREARTAEFDARIKEARAGIEGVWEIAGQADAFASDLRIAGSGVAGGATATANEMRVKARQAESDLEAAIAEAITQQEMELAELDAEIERQQVTVDEAKADRDALK